MPFVVNSHFHSATPVPRLIAREPSTFTRDATHLMRNSPAIHSISSFEVVSTSMRVPKASVLSETAVRELAWKGAKLMDWVREAAVCVFMVAIFAVIATLSNVQKMEKRT